MGVVVGALQIVASIGSANQYQRVLEKAELSASITELTHQLDLERDRAVYYVGAGRTPKREAELRDHFATVDAAAAKVKEKAGVISAAHGESAWNVARSMLGRLAEIKVTRETVIKSQLPALPAMLKYAQIINVFQQFHDEIGQGVEDEALSNGVRALSALTKAKDAASEQRALLAGAAEVGFFQTGELERFMAARAKQESEVAVFKALASLDELQVYDDTVTGTLIDRAESYRLRAMAQTNEGTRLNIDPKRRDDSDRWFEAISGTIDSMRAVEKRMTDSITLQSRGLEDSARRNALLAGAGSALLLILVLSVTVIMAQSLVKPLRRLRMEALQIAGQRLPDTVRTLRESGDDTALRVEPIGVHSQDEVGEVARAFDEVHREAVRLAGEESRLRANVNAMFVNLSRRSQTLVERQITLIDGLEQGEQDEQRLGNLFKLDHLATRMRRNSENLLVLAGQDPPRRWSQPVKMVDVARASLSEVENYERVVLQVPDGVSVAGQAVNDVIHLLAELIENALSFSPRETRVTVSGSRIDGGGVMLSITDSGIGMTQEELAQANERLTDAPIVDVSVSRRMGLFVVARLAHRHGIRVQLRPHGSGGLTAMVLVPESLLGQQTAAYANSPSTPREEVYAAPQAAASASWPATPYQMGPGHPSYPSDPQPSGSWPATPQWQSSGPPSNNTGGGWPSEPLDVWVPARGPATGDQPLPKRPTQDEPPSAWSRTSEPSSFGTSEPSPFGTVEPSPFGAAEPASPFGTVEPSSAAQSRNSRFDFPDTESSSFSSRFDFPETESAATGPMPVVKPASSGDEFLPIFAAVESAWFEQTESGATWGSSQADAGWNAAQAVVQPVNDGSTASGLPKRVPKANLVPGSADTASAPKGVAPMPSISPDRVRSRLSSFQQGFRAARDDISEGRSYPAAPRNESREEGA
ncbi:HAMP domain-containing protein [Nonomuraea sp. NN258]|uniref:sensor histidine kinase n=1 Tax=Nonomuraea antri TaxID=2730852 RepID=UPI001568DD4A|nr:nitrate- and nitrite sensing domain-containing protein [Nonomuraea antri]NRQ34413.1 HAMP domain-containing protein [Nonomuraea antri]